MTFQVARGEECHTVADVYKKGDGDYVKIEGIVTMIGRGRWCSTWTGGFLRRQEIEIIDPSWPLGLSVTVWGAKVQNITVDSAVRVEGKVSSWRGRSLNARTCPTLLERDLKQDLKRRFHSLPAGQWSKLNKSHIVSMLEALRRRDATNGVDRSGKWNWLQLKDAHNVPRYMIHNVRLAYARKRGSIQKRALNFKGMVHVKDVASFVARVVVNDLLARVITLRPKKKQLSLCLAAWIRSGASLDCTKCAHIINYLFKKKKGGKHAAKCTRTQSSIMIWIARDLSLEVVRAFFVLSFDTKTGAPIFAAAHSWRRAEKKLPAYTHCLKPNYGRPKRFALGRLVPKVTSSKQNIQCRLLQRGPCLGPKRSKASGASLNEVLLALTFETKRQPKLLGAGGPGALDRIWRTLRTLQHKEANQNKYHLLTLDVRSCYDSIDQKRVFQLAQNALHESQYIIIPNQGKKRGRALSDSASSRALKRARCVSREALLAELKEFIFHHYVSCGFGRRLRYFKQITGIPQGAAVSPLLCDLYYADFEKSTPVDSLLRVVDDTLGIALVPQSLNALVNVYQNAAPELGITLRPHKTQATFDLSTSASSHLKNSTISFCGLEIDNSLSVTRQRRSFYCKHHPSAPPLSRTALDTRLRRCLHTQLHPIFFDLLLHSRSHALANLRLAFKDTFLQVEDLWSPFRNRAATRSLLHELAKFAAAVYRRSQRKFNLNASACDNRRHTPLRFHDFFQACYLAFRAWLLEKDSLVIA